MIYPEFSGAKWFLQRKLLTPTFHFKTLESFTDTFAEKAGILTKNLESKATGEYFNIMPDIATYTLTVICGKYKNCFIIDPIRYYILSTTTSNLYNSIFFEN